MTDDEIRAELNLDHIDEYAALAATLLKEHHVAGVVLTPGDMTQYRIVISRPWLDVTTRPPHRSPQLHVDLSRLGTSYPWMGGAMEADYVLEKWVPNGSRWTAVVLATFLTALSKAMAA